MAAAQLLDTRLQLTLEDSVNEVTGEVVYKVKSFNNVKTTATPEALFSITSTLIPLQAKSLYMVKRNDSTLITAQ